MRTLKMSVEAKFGATLFASGLNAFDLLDENTDWALKVVGVPAVLSPSALNHLATLGDHVSEEASGRAHSISYGWTALFDLPTGGGTIGSQAASGLPGQGGSSIDADGGGNLSGYTYGALGFPDLGTGAPKPIEEDGADSTLPSGTPTELLVQFAPGASAANIAAAASRIGGQVVETIHTPAMAAAGEGVLVRVKIGAGADIDQAIQALSQRPGVVFAEPNWGVSVEATSDDPAYVDGTLWGMYGDETSPANQYGSQAGEAWQVGYGGSYKVVAGVVDTGIDYTHPDLYLNIWLNQKEIPTNLALKDVDSDGLITFQDLNAAINSGQVTDHNKNGYIDAGDLLADNRWENGVDNDGNGYVDDLIGWDFVNNDNDPYDDHGHGTHVSGTIGGEGGNGTGVAGVAWDVQLMALKFLNKNGSGSTANAVKALDYYTTAGTLTLTQDFVATNNSWGGGGYSQALLDSIVRGAKDDVLFVAAAGNGGRDGRGDNNDSSAHYPSNYDTTAGAGYDAVIAVASITKDGALSTFSNYGENTVDLGAPGQSIYSTLPGGYGTYSGTSMATPHVTGAIALYAAATGLSALEIKTAVLGSAAPTTSLTGKTVTDGRLDAGTLMNGVGATGPAAPLLVGISEDTGISASDGITNDQTLIISGTAEAGIAVKVYRDGVLIGEAAADSSGAWSLDYSVELPERSYSFTATATDAEGNTSAPSQALTVVVDIATPAPAGLDLIAASDTGASSSDNETSDTTPTITGTAEAGATVDLRDAIGSLLGTATVDGNGSWNVTTSPLADGTYSLTATATDLAGNTSAASAALSVVIDTTAASATVSAITVASDNHIDSAESAAEGGVLIRVTVDQVSSSDKVYVVVGGSSTKHEAALDTSDLTGLTYSVALPYGELSGSSSVSSFVEDLAGNASQTASQSYTTEQPSTVYGTDGSDTLVGSALADTISGLPNPTSGSTALGEGTVDVLTGMGGADIFVFGDSRGAFYDDDNPRAGNNGKSDYGQINDFLSTVDQIQLFGPMDQYLLQPWTQNGVSGTGIFLDSNGNDLFDSRDELIGLVANTESPPLDLASLDFLYVV